MRLVRDGREGTAGETEVEAVGAVIEEMLYTKLHGATDGGIPDECIIDGCAPNGCTKEEITLIMAQGPKNEQ